MENRRALCYNNVLHQSESKIGGICFGTSNHCDLPGGAEPAVGNLPRNRKLLECAGAHAPCLCRYLRLPAERGGFRAHPRHAARVRLPHVRHRGGRGLYRHQHLRHPRARRDARLRQRRRAGPYEKPPSGAENLSLRLHDGAARCGRQDQAQLPPRRRRLQSPPALALSGASAVGADKAQAHFCRRRLRRQYRRGHPRRPRFEP